MRLLLALGVAIGVLATAAVQAHHSFAAVYDANDPVTLRGKITEVKLTNPHSWIYIDVRNDDGTTANWGIEGGTPNALFRKGITKTSIALGTEILVTGFRARNNTNTAVGVNVTFTDGRKIFFGGSAPGADGLPAVQ